VSRVVELVADGVVVDGSAVVGVVVDERRRDDGLVAVELTVEGLEDSHDGKRTVFNGVVVVSR